MVQRSFRWIRRGSKLVTFVAGGGKRDRVAARQGAVEPQAGRWLVALAGAVALLALGASPASATTATLQRAVQNLTQFPLDIVASPITAVKSEVDNMRNIGDTTAVRVGYAVPGYVWNLMVDAGAGMIRGISGVLELGPGVVMLFSKKEMEPLFQPAEDNNALVEFDNPIYRVKFGIDYTTAAD